MPPAKNRLNCAVFTFAGERYEHCGKPLIADNPVKRLSSIRAWCDLPRRKGYIPASKLGDWWRATDALDPTPRDLLRLILLTGLRKEEASSLRWEHVDLTAQTLHVPITKNRRPLTLPLSAELAALLAGRQDRDCSPYVSGYFVLFLGHCNNFINVLKINQSVTSSIYLLNSYYKK